MLTLRKQQERGRANFGWLDSRHTFSFGHYYDANEMGFSALRVINDDRVSPGAGFDTHGHKDMEIISYVLEGAIAHKDSEGNEEVLPAGEFQLMSAGSGIYHSEFNPSPTEPLHFLQIWIQPNTYGQAPGYQQKKFAATEGLTLIASENGDQGSLTIKQDARLYQLQLTAGGRVELETSPSRHYYVHLVKGKLAIDDVTLSPGDGAKLKDIQQLRLFADGEAANALVFDLP